MGGMRAEYSDKRELETFIQHTVAQPKRESHSIEMCLCVCEIEFTYSHYYYTHKTRDFPVLIVITISENTETRF